MKRMIRASEYKENYSEYFKQIDEMIEQGATLDDLFDYIDSLVDTGEIEDYEKQYIRNISRRKFREYEREKEEAEMDPADLYGLAKGSYSVSAFTDAFGEMVERPKTYTDPGQAIKKWCQLQKKYPSCAMITGYRSDVQALRDWAVEHADQVTEWCKMCKVPYKTDWIIEECKKPARPSSSKHDAPDQIHPFGLG